LVHDIVAAAPAGSSGNFALGGNDPTRGRDYVMYQISGGNFALGGKDGAPNSVTVFRGGEAHVPPHLSKEQDIALKAGDRVRVGTPGGGGYGDPRERDAKQVAEDVRLGYYTAEQAREMFGVVPSAEGSAIDRTAAPEKHG
ncbi:hydantoinase B/oxoprolinase family protein, partial [Mesorhizobium sp. M2A.F.Ca.ET.067.02.1.1]|uniref:hydantoinase B/oxoprolinase family protein n=1 Tax=Mesorhizobium sp. M2A.F.Ca.ET.067.02.1.1 TaxID=2496749 RepID=UPI000FD4FFE5